MIEHSKHNSICVWGLQPYLNIVSYQKQYVSRTDLETMKTFLESAMEANITDHCRFTIGTCVAPGEMWAYNGDSIEDAPQTTKSVMLVSSNRTINLTTGQDETHGRGAQNDCSQLDDKNTIHSVFIVEPLPQRKQHITCFWGLERL